MIEQQKVVFDTGFFDWFVTYNDHAAIVRELLGIIGDFSSMKIQYLTTDQSQRIAEFRKEYGGKE
jgi:hypothetical protein